MSSNWIRILRPILLILLCTMGCRPSDSQRDNRRLMDAILTAVVIRNPTELANDKALLEERRQKDQLSPGVYESLKGLIAQAEQGDWETAEKRLYEFRKKQPFPK